MLTLALLLFFRATTFGKVIAEDGSKTHIIGQWKDIDFFRHSGDWIDESLPRAVVNMYEAPSFLNIASYRRNTTSPETTKVRLLFLDRGGFTWTYSPRTTSWTKLSTSTGSERSAVEASLARVYGSTIETLCESRIVVAGGTYYTRSATQFSTNEAWLFNGEIETWSLLPAATQFFLGARNHYTAFSYRQEESSCRCRDSLFVYAATDEVASYNVNYNASARALWELRCIDDRNAENMTYEWIESVLNTTQWPVAHTPLYFLRGFAANSTHVFWLSDAPDIILILNMATGNWSTKKVANLCRSASNTLNPINLFHGVLSDAVFLKKDLLVVSFFEPYGVGGIYDLKASTYQCFSLSKEKKLPFLFTRNLLLGDDTFYLAVTNTYDHTVAFVKIAEKLVNRDDHATLETAVRYPMIGDYDHRLVGMSDSTWYLIKADPSGLQMWKFELDMLRWTLYDPDTAPETPGTSLEAATSVAKRSFVAFFGSKHGFGFSGRDELWMYATILRTWTRVASRGNAPKKMTSYATMNSLSNGSLILFGGIDNETTSIWMATVDYKGMTATWERLCCNVNQQLPNELQKWSSSAWRNRLYVFFGQRTTSNCDPSMHYINLDGNDASEWKTKKQQISNSTFCEVRQSDYGRFAYSRNENGSLLLADLNQMQYKIADESESSIPWKEMLLARNNEVFSYSPGQKSPINNSTESVYKEVQLKRFKLVECQPGSFSREYSLYPCQLCPKGEYSNHYGATNCTSCPPSLVTRTTGSISINNCTCTSTACIYGDCIVQSDHTTLCICYAGFTGKKCETPTMYLVGVGIVVGLLVVCAFYYCIKRVKKHKTLAKYTRVELEMAEQMAEELANIWSVKTDEIEFKRMIGEGSFGDVFASEYRDLTVAIKVLKIKANDCTNEQLQEFKDESELLRSIFHANIVRFIGTGKTTENKPFIALEYMERGSVRKALDDEYAEHPMEMHLQLIYALHAAKGMRHLHRINRMHRDLKSDNLLINDRGIVKVADLGCTKIAPKITTDDDDSSRGKIRGSRAVGTVFFRAPEIFRGEAYNTAVDVYSYGITLWEIQTAKNPYFEKFDDGLTANQILDQIVDDDARPDFPFHCNVKLKKLAISCWSAIPHKRPTFEDIVQTLEEIRSGKVHAT